MAVEHGIGKWAVKMTMLRFVGNITTGFAMMRF